MDNKDKMAFPFYEPGTGFGSVSEGLTKRELWATMVDVSKDIENMSTGLVERLVGRPRPDDSVDYYLWRAEVEAKMRVIKADALLAELSKP